ncbi:ribosomal-protein-alanine acetyltransferase [Aggregatibacter actinomycetemcomitans serotype e str. SC1083]|uniref:[Ribosomal protein bS18]-alanine N-acetyltransferase n=1 Tax=Aggregatibacter actinomycetemcomitans serotype e str. SC1083 TaxID=907488 RepID=G4A927_AGGAC|nr:ribosomal protein S18-alanine N-acetyltransferase [Aggregatibacter actinomycetemcomitans]EGY33607.1 ribosomal-protein-alanine acetyltransferase [Aggregatibacter actinomycetemcomitans serotype e str. SC1083]KYK74122.1 alanine acetyltransferase [Aggregatibacter actinomycetemcomitans serotype e str. SA3096]KYK81569.1 alanine acetyltransferase [Aggregatibacter actinomycetemcomitans serotype e str. SC936]KYK94774.1 alanine acetyltransferase [Aggregatibacter actinomycetemcomitans serotype e str. A
MIHISPIEPSDFDRLYLIEQAAHAVPWSLGTLKNNQGERYFNLKIGEESRIDGFAICQTVLDEATLFNIALDPQKQGRGLGRRLLTELMTQLKQKGILTLWLEVRESNKKALALYDSLGFNQVDIRKNYYPTADGKRENAVVMAAYL